MATLPTLFGTQGNTKASESQKNIQALLGAGVPQSSISAFKTAQKGRMGTADATSIFNTFSAAQTPAVDSTTSTPAPQDTYTTLLNNYLGTLTPSATEQTATDQLGKLTASKELGLQYVTDPQNNPVPEAFQTGQQAAITSRASAQAVPLQAQIATEQAKRQAATDVSKGALDYEVQKEQQTEAAKEAAATLAEQKSEFSQNLSFDEMKYAKDLGLSKAQLAQLKTYQSGLLSSKQAEDTIAQQQANTDQQKANTDQMLAEANAAKASQPNPSDWQVFQNKDARGNVTGYTIINKLTGERQNV